MFMPFFEIPNWCLNNSKIKDETYCDPDIYPSSGIPKLPEWLSSTIEIFCLIVLLFFTFFRRTFRLLSTSAWIREIIQTVLTIIACIDIIVALIFRNGVFIGNFIRIILIIDMIRGLREAIKRICLVLFDSKEIMCLIFGNVIFFGWIGFRLFRGTSEGEVYFPTMIEGCWSLLVLMTTANFPDVMLPAYTVNKAYALFFIVYLVIGLYFLLYLVLAIFYSNYKNRVEKTIDKFDVIREKFLLSKFKEYDLNNKGFLTQEECSELISDLLDGQKSTKRKIQINIMAKNIQQKSKGKITPDSFILFFDIMEIFNKENPLEGKPIKKSKEKSRLQYLVRHPKYDAIVIVINALNLFSIFGKDVLNQYGQSKAQAYAWIYFEFVISLLMLAEMIFLFISFGVMNAIKRRNHIKFEIIFQIVTFSFFIHFLAVHKTASIIKVLEITVILRSLRLLKLFKELKQWRIIIRTVESLVSPFFNLLLVAYVLYLLFATIGDKLFGGIINTEAKEIFFDTSIPDKYVQVNFNDVYCSFVTLFTLMVINNWFVTVSMYVAVTGSTYTRIFFICFYFFSVIVTLNIFVAFTIDMYSSIDSLENQHDPSEEEEAKQEFDPDETDIKMVLQINSDNDNTFENKSRLEAFKTMAISNSKGLINYSNEDVEGKRVDVIFKDDRYSESKECLFYVNDENNDLTQALLEDNKESSKIFNKSENSSNLIDLNDLSQENQDEQVVSEKSKGQSYHEKEENQQNNLANDNDS